MHTDLSPLAEGRTGCSPRWAGALSDRAELASRGALVLLALALPFEAPLFRLGPLEITSVELALYAALAAWGVHGLLSFLLDRSALRAAARSVRTDALAMAALLFWFVLLASAVAAPTHRVAALKFVLRSLSGLLAFFAARTGARHAATARWTVLALIAGALASAVTALLECFYPDMSYLWAAFHSASFDTLGLERASGTFAYPTIGAMYWEASVPLLVVAPFLRPAPSSGRAPPPRIRVLGRASLTVAGSLLLVGAILASATRSSLVGAAVACVALLALGRPWGPWLPRAAGGAMAVLAVSLVVALHGADTGSRLGQRLRFWHDEQWLRAEYHVGSTPTTVGAGEWFEVKVEVRNTGTLTWRRSGAKPTRLAYHWEPLAGPANLSHYEGVRTDLPEDVPPGRALAVVARARGPAEAGRYRLRWDLVQEGVSWFSDQGNPTPERAVEVVGAAHDAALLEGDRTPLTANDPISPPRRLLWRAALSLWRERPLLGIGPDNFRRRYQAILSPAPNGQPYRDTRLHANSLYLETLADVGLAGAAALVTLLAALVRRLRAQHGARQLLGFGCGLSAAVFFVHGFLDYFFEFTPLFGLFWVLLGLTAAAPPRAPERA